MESESGLDNIVADGVLGLALPLLSHTGKTVLQRMFSQTNISTFCFFLTGTEEGSYIIFGPPQPAWYVPGTLVYVPAVTDMWWAVDGRMTVGGTTFQEGPFLLDSGTSYITAPNYMYVDFLEGILP